MALYKGLTVAVYSVEKPEISLSDEDLVELISVRSLVSICYFTPYSIGVSTGTHCLPRS